jgi:alpha-L-rhamnosidase
VLTAHGHADLALALARQRSYPSWGFWLENGATSTWEHWSTEARSLDHYFLGTYDEWLYEAVAGIEPLDVGYRNFVVRPRFLHEPGSSHGQVATPYGPASVGWSSDGRIAMLDIEVPVDCTAQLVLPCDDLAGVREGDLPLTDAPGIREVRVGPGRITAVLGSGRYRVRAVLAVPRDDRLRREG